MTKEKIGVLKATIKALQKDADTYKFLYEEKTKEYKRLIDALKTLHEFLHYERGDE